MLKHLNAGTVTALIGSLVGFAVMIVPKLAPFQDQAKTQATGLAVAILNLIQLVDEIIASVKGSGGSAPSGLVGSNMVKLLIASALLVPFLGGCRAGQPLDPLQRTTVTIEGASFVLNSIGNARNAGLITQDEINAYKPIALAFNSAKLRAEKSLAAGDTNTYDSAMAQLAAAYAQLQPLLQKIDVRRQAVVKPATTAPSPL